MPLIIGGVIFWGEVLRFLEERCSLRETCLDLSFFFFRFLPFLGKIDPSSAILLRVDLSSVMLWRALRFRKKKGLYAYK